MSYEPHRIVVGIDFGTTYTAVAWAESTRPDQVEIIKNWPTSGQLVGSQVPTEIAYHENSNTDFSWGYNINLKLRKIKWFKLGFETQEKLFPLPPDMTVGDITRDFFSALYKHIQSTLYKRFDAGVMQMTQLEFVLTVPAIWSDAAKAKTEQAAIRAGFGNENRLQLLSEPESAAIFTLKNLGNVHSRVAVGDRIVCCDAGGGTVDLISYEVQSLVPQLSVVECTVGTGDFCGSTFIDLEFEQLFKKRMGSHYSKLSALHRQTVMKEFEQNKVAFRDDEATPTFYVMIPTFDDLEEAGIVGGMFEISREEMRQMFDPVVNQVLELVKAQVMAVSTATAKASSILLVGGFGESEYLYSRIQSWAAQYQVQVLNPREASTAIVRGAVLKGLESTQHMAKTKISRRARRSYGVPSTHEFTPGKHAHEDLWIDPQTGKKLVKNQVSWFVKQNQIMSDEETFRFSFRRDFKVFSPWVDTLVSSSAPVPPMRRDDTVVNHCTITSDLTTFDPKRVFGRKWHKFRRYYTAEYELVMGVRNNNISIHLEYNGRSYGAARVVFDEI